MREQLDKLFSPKSIAVIGASERPDSMGEAVMQNLLNGEYSGNIYAVNPKYRSVKGVRCYRLIAKVPAKVDLAILVTPTVTIRSLVEECGQAGVGAIMIMSAGVRETDEEGRVERGVLMSLARQYNIRILGPGCYGLIHPAFHVNATYSAQRALPGKIAFISQSGALCASILDWASVRNVGFSHFVSVGSMVDVSFSDLIDYFGTDARTSCILIYMEHVRDARKFLSAARAFARSKPIIVLKAGRTPESGQAALSHTGALAGQFEAYGAAFARAGIVRVDTIAQLFHAAHALSSQSRPKGNRLAIVTNAGGPGILAIDALISGEGQVAQLSAKTIQALDKLMPNCWSRSNPVDITDEASPEHYSACMKIVLKDSNVDAVLVILSPQGITNPSASAEAVVNVSADTQKPIYASWMGEVAVAEGRAILEKGGIPQYRFPESAIAVFLQNYQYDRNLALLQETPPDIPEQFSPQKEVARTLVAQVLQQGRTMMTESEAKNLLGCYGFPINKHLVVETAQEAIDFVKQTGYPVVVKAVALGLLHKTEVDAVRLNIYSDEALAAAVEDVIGAVRKRRPELRVIGALIEPMVSKPYELLIGARRDPVFGPLIVFGKGGVAAEVFRDTGFGIPPLNMNLARQIIESTHIYELLKGYKNLPKVQIDQLSFILCKFSYLLMDIPEIQEMDINPLVMDKKGAMILDAHVVLNPALATPPNRPYQHLVISPYPEEYVKTVFLRNGRQVVLRPIRPEDEPLEAKMIDYLSSQTLYFRFLGFIPKVTHDMLSRFTQIDYDREMAIIAELTDDDTKEKQMIGVVRIVADAWKENAEYAITVADDWQNKGLGRILTEYILDIARQKGIRKVYASVLASNRSMLALFRRLGFRMEKEDASSFYVELEL